MPKRISRRKNSAKIKFQVVLESLSNNNSKIEISGNYEITPI